MEEIMIGREMNPKEMIPEEENQEGAKISHLLNYPAAQSSWYIQNSHFNH